jgi:hypothetical protein
LSHAAAPLATLAAIGLFYLFSMRPGHAWGDDFSMYISHAQNIVQGKGYDDTGYIYNPGFHLIGPTTYPPVFPLLLAPVCLWFGLNLTAMKVEILLFFLLALGMVYLLLRTHLSAGQATAVIAILGFNPFFWKFKDQVLSDIPFLLFVYLALYLYCRPGEGGWGRALSLGVATYLAYGTRSVGIALLLSLAAADLIRRRKLTGLTWKAVMVAGVLIAAQNAFLHSEKAYADQVGVSWSSFVGSVPAYARFLSDLWENGYSKAGRVLLFGIVSGLAAVGFWRRVRGGITIGEVFPALYLIPILVFPIQTDSRYLIPVIPLYLAWAVAGGEAVARRLRLEKLLPAAVGVCIAAAYLGHYSRTDFGPLPDGVGKSETRQFFEWARTQAGQVVVFRKPRALVLFGGVRAAALHESGDDASLWSYLARIQASYLVVGPRDLEAQYQAFLGDFVSRHRERLEEVYSNPDFRVYRIQMPASSQARR